MIIFMIVFDCFNPQGSRYNNSPVGGSSFRLGDGDGDGGVLSQQSGHITVIGHSFTARSQKKLPSRHVVE